MCFINVCKYVAKGNFLISLSSLLYFDFNFHTAGEFKFHQRVDSLCCSAVDVDETLVIGELELLASLLVDEGGAVDCEDALVSGEGNRTAHHGTCCFHGLDDFLGRLVHEFVVVGLQFDSDFLTHVVFVIDDLLSDREPA